MKRYQVSWEMVRRWIKDEGVLLRCKSQKQLKEFSQAILELDRLLATIPLSFGEPHFDYKHIGLTVCIGFHGPLIVHYGVDRKNRTVFVSGLGWR